MVARLHKSLLEYGVAVLALTAAVLLRWLLNPILGPRLPFATIFAAIALAVWYGGWRPALLITVLGYLVIYQWFILTEPGSSLSWHSLGGLVGLLLYLLSAGVMLVLGNAMRAAQARAEVSARAAQALQHSLEEADRRKDEFLATLSHELRNPLAPLRSALQIASTGNDPAALRQAHAVMERQLHLLVRIVDDLLELSRVRSGKLEIRKERVPLGEMVQTAVETCRPLLDAAGQQLIVALPATAVYLDADATRLSQVISNLLNNASKYSPPGNPIRLAVETEGSDVLLRVKDAGIGISPELLPRIFDLFLQGERSQEGLGIGLTLVRRLVELHGGRVEARSEGPGLGSEFIVRLPIASGPAPRLSRPAELSDVSSLGARRILIADDNRDSANTLAMIFEMLGSEVRTAYDGLEAVELEDRFRPDVVLLDVGMPKLNGYEAARRIRQDRSDEGVVLIAMTGWVQEEDRRRSMEAGFDFHLIKPIDPAELKRVLASSLREEELRHGG